jgi:hypothetical protein
MPASTLLPPPPPIRPGIPRTTGSLLGLGLAQLAVWLGSALYNFYGGSRHLLLTVQPGLSFGAAHPHLATTLASPAGYYHTGTLGQLLYQPPTLSEYFLFYHIGSLSGLDALFLASAGFYLHHALGRARAARALAPAARRALGLTGLASCLMYVLTMVVQDLASQVFAARTHHLFTLGHQAGPNVLYVALGLLLGMCSRFLQQGPQESQLT